LLLLAELFSQSVNVVLAGTQGSRLGDGLV
jgi:hypothetical protein